MCIRLFSCSVFFYFLFYTNVHTDTRLTVPGGIGGEGRVEGGEVINVGGKEMGGGFRYFVVL